MKKKPALEIAAMLAPKAAARIALAFDDPEAYARKYRRDLDDRNLDETDPWVAVVDALAQAGALQSIDWKTDWDELRFRIDKLMRRKLRWPKGDYDERSTLELLELAGERLVREEGMVLAHLDISSDEYELVLVPKAQAKRLEKLGHIDLFIGRDLKKFERERKAKQKKAHAKENRDPNRQRQFIHPDGRVFVYWGVSYSVGGKKIRGWCTLKTRLKEDWTKGKRGSCKDKPAPPKGFVEVTREEWIKRQSI